MSGKYDVTVGNEENGIRNMSTAAVHTFFLKHQNSPQNFTLQNADKQQVS